MLKALGVWDRDVAQEGEPLCKLLRFASAVVWRSCSALFGHIRMPKGAWQNSQTSNQRNSSKVAILQYCTPFHTLSEPNRLSANYEPFFSKR